MDISEPTFPMSRHKRWKSTLPSVVITDISISGHSTRLSLMSSNLSRNFVFVRRDSLRISISKNSLSDMSSLSTSLFPMTFKSLNVFVMLRPQTISGTSHWYSSKLSAASCISTNDVRAESRHVKKQPSGLKMRFTSLSTSFKHSNVLLKADAWIVVR